MEVHPRLGLGGSVGRALCRSRFPDRGLSSRMVRRRKPQEGAFAAPKAESRWCARGHHGPDVGKLQTYAPTPQTETLMLFVLLVQAYDMLQSVADCRNAFCQSERLHRPQGRLFVEPCEGSR